MKFLHVVLLYYIAISGALRIELSVTALSGPSGQPVLDYRFSRALRSRTETLLLPKQACFHLHLRPITVQNVRTRTDGLSPRRTRYAFISTAVGFHPVSSLGGLGCSFCLSVPREG